MKPILYVVAGLLLVNVMVATFLLRSPATAPGAIAPVVNEATRQGQEAWMAKEPVQEKTRDKVRTAMLTALERPWATYCTADGRKDLIDAINYYYGQRTAEARSKAATYGEAARRFAVAAWSTTDDGRIERLLSETLARGYVAIDELQPVARTPLSASANGQQTSPNPCAN
jgi:hypothetical protein